ncbi:MAG: long-chain-fatty-acid--CoA ligase [Chloroflexota bacterium]
MYLTQGLKRALQTSRNNIATIDQINGQEQRHTWAEFGERIAKLAGAFQTLGLEKGGRVALLALNGARYLEYYYAVPWAGGIVVPLNIRLAPPELVFLLNDSGTEILIVDETFKAMLPAFEGKLETVKHIVYAGDGIAPEGTHDYEAILAAADAIDDVEAGGDDVAGIFYTGGTTGLPKGVMLTHDNLVNNAMNTLVGLDYNTDTVYLHAAPMFHLADGASTFAVSIMGGTHSFVPKFDPEDTLQALQSYGVTNGIMVPTMINMVANHPSVGSYNLSKLKLIGYGGSPMPEAVLLKAKEVFPTCQFLQAYGMTELSPILTILPDEYHVTEGPLAGKIRSAGRVVYNVEAKIVDEQDQEVPRGVVGEIIARGPIVMKGYWNRPKETAEALRNGWMHTQDAGYMDEDGFIFISDRLKDMIISGGENVYSVEVENAIYQHPAIAMCAVIGVPDEEWGERVHAIVTCKEGQTVDEDELIAFCKERIANYKCPRSMALRPEPMPISGAGKILKSTLRAPYWEKQTRQVH